MTLQDIGIVVIVVMCLAIAHRNVGWAAEAWGRGDGRTATMHGLIVLAALACLVASTLPTWSR